ncbi:Cell division protein DedD [Ferriphaselus amnicola]|uniref:Cell division protein DedD n=1 Tax=Ferriphaselus amnicola TaxID=1188319 RepID=A0A2Z6G9X9_9PROT|nr:SPOR domain-containing protein [Ferriphaselus amnicola]BBE50341.1 Cell division protein DedD [Ferriphaselus amnicola]
MATKQVTDEESSLKRQARRRLIGAVALVTAVAVILPMVLDSEPKPAGVDIELRIPDKEKVAAFRPQEPTPAPVVVASAVPADSAPVAADTAVAASAVAPLPQAAAPEPAMQSEKKPLPVSAIKPEPKAEVKSPAKVEPTHKAEDAKADGGKASFVLQIGAYANAEIAKDWQVKLKKQGFHAYTESAGERTRLRVGPFSSRDAADGARQKLVGLGLHPDLIDLGSK